MPRSQKRKRISSMTDSSVNKNNNNKRRSTSIQGKAVRFSQEPPCQWKALDYFHGLDAAGEEQLRAELWYTSQDFEQFLEERLQTMQIWRAVGGNSRLIEPNYSLRGLESFQSTLLSGGETQYWRSRHVNAVLKEQEWQRMIKAPSPEKLSQVSLQHSSGAVARAVRLGIKDSLDATAYYQMDSSPSSVLCSTTNSAAATTVPNQLSFSSSYSNSSKVSSLLDNPSQSPLSLRKLMPRLSSSHASSAVSREYLSKLSLGLSPMDGLGIRHCGSTSSTSTTHRNVVNVPMLKQLNKEFLHDLVKNGGAGGLSLPTSSSAGSISYGTSSTSTCLGTLDLLNEALKATADNNPPFQYGSDEVRWS